MVLFYFHRVGEELDEELAMKLQKGTHIDNSATNGISNGGFVIDDKDEGSEQFKGCLSFACIVTFIV